MKTCALLLSVAAATAMFTLSALAGNTCRDGVAKAVPLKNGVPPAIDGKLDDWDLSGVVRCWNAEALADRQNASLYFMYDDAHLYFAAELALLDHEAKNENRPQDRFWLGDVVQVRLATDPAIPYPLDLGTFPAPDPAYLKNNRVTCFNCWKNTLDGNDHLYVTPGAFLDGVNVDRPEGSDIKIVAEGYALTMEARVPWAALGVPDGKLPVPVGGRLPAVVDIKWFPSTDGYYTVAIFRQDPGAFAFQNHRTWGQLEFVAEGNLPATADTYEAVAEAARLRDAPDTEGAARIAFTLPKKAKVSVNIFDDKGGVVRELAGGEPHEAGECVFFWDGRDALGFPCATDRDYRWGAYAHDGLDVEYFGTVGTGGTPPYETRDGKGCWGGDHGPVVDAACDDSGRYFVWHMSESGKGIVKTDFDGNVLWRTMPFVVDGWGNYSCMASDGEFLYLVYERRGDTPVVKLVRVSCRTGNYEPWPSGDGAMDIDIAPEPPALPDGCAVRPEYRFDIVGCAVRGGEVFLSDFAGNRILVHAAATGVKTRELSGIPGPRGLWLRDGALYAAAIPGAVMKVDPATGATETLVSEGLAAPHGIALDAAGRLYVSDLGTSQQIKVFAPAAGAGKSGWRLLRALGKEGGRGFLGRLDPDAFLFPFGLAVDKTGVLMVPEASSPKIVDLIDTADGRTLRRVYGYTAYSPSNIPDCDDPLLQYYSLSGPSSFARARIPERGGVGDPDAVWDFRGAGRPEFGCVMDTMNMPTVLRCTNGRKYLVPDGTPDFRDPTCPMTVCLLDSDEVKPVAGCYRVPDPDRRAATQSFELWADANGDGRMEASEKTRVDEVAGRAFALATVGGTMTMAENGDLFLLTMDNFVIGIPCRGFAANGAPQWAADAAYIAIPEILPGFEKLYCTWRLGLVGMRRDREGNFYAAVTADPEYATEEYTKYMHQGMGHTADVGAVFMTKYDPEGRLLWRTGRKAVGGMKDGEILHHWCHAGLVNDAYSAAASEWGVFTLYTKDGFYVDHLFDIPGLPGRGIPYAFGGEDFSGRIQYFPERDEVWAFNAGHTFRVTGFEKGLVKGEWRTEGTVRLERVKPLVFPGMRKKPIDGVAFARRDGRLVFTAHVDDPTPLVNVATAAGAVFKGGDAVGFEMGPATAPEEIPERRPSGRLVGYSRVLAARMGGRDAVIGFKPFSDGERRPQSYATPAGGASDFEFCGEIPGATVAFAVDADGKGYRAEISVPEEFLELDFGKPVYYDAEALLSGEGGRGMQTLEKAYLNNPDSSSVLMTDDVPTEARLHPAGWKRLE